MNKVHLFGYLSIYASIYLIFQAGDASVGWALGYVLTLSNLLPAERATLRKALTTEAWGMLIFLFVFLLATVIVHMSLHTCDGKKKDRESVN